MKYEELPENKIWMADVIHKVIERNCSKSAVLRASMQLDRSEKTVKRYVDSIAKGEYKILIHGNTGKIPATKIPEKTREKIVNIYCEQFEDAAFAHFKEILEEDYDIKVSESSIFNILKKEALLYSPKATRSTKRAMHKLHRELENNPDITAEQREVYDRAKYLVDHYENGARRSRSKYFGEVIQMDASSLKWNGTDVWHLHLAVDDATGEVVGARFEPQETLRGYLYVLKQIIENYGVPLQFKTDRRTCFEQSTHQPRQSYGGRRGCPSAFNEKDDMGTTLTQFGLILDELGSSLKASSEPLFKPRIERMNSSFQTRLPIDLRRHGITDMDTANAFLPEFVSNYNHKFSAKTKDDIDNNVFEECELSADDLYLLLTPKTQKKITSSAIKFNKTYWAIYNNEGERAFFRDKTPCTMLELLNGEYILQVGNSIYGLKEIPIRKASSELVAGEEKDTELEAPSKPPYIPCPSPTHPWRSPNKRREKKNG